MTNSLLFTSKQFQRISNSLTYLQQLQFLTLIFNQKNGFGPHSAKFLGNALKSLHELLHLNLKIRNFNQINQGGAYNLSQGIKSLSGLRSIQLYLEGCNIQRQGAILIVQDKIQSDGAVAIGRAIKNLYDLNELKIQIGEQNEIKKIGAYEIGVGMQFLTNLTHLRLIIKDNNDIESDGISSICKSISKMIYLKYLYLNFGNQNQIQSSTIYEISQAIKQLANLKYFQIDIHINEITSNYISEITDLIRLINSININFIYQQLDNTIKCLITTESNRFCYLDTTITIKSNIYNSKGICQNIFQPIESINQIPSIKILQIQAPSTQNLDQEICYKLGDSLKQLLLLENLQINFGENKIGFHVLDLGNSLSKLANLKHLQLNNISEIEIKLIGRFQQRAQLPCKNQNQQKQSKVILKFLSSSIQTITRLHIDLNSNRIGDAGASGLGSALAQCTNLSNLTLDLGWNEIGDAGASGLGSALAQCTNLSNLRLHLGSNKIGDAGVSGLGFALAQCTNLSNLRLHLRSNKIGDAGASGLGSALAQCASGLGSALAQCTNLSNLTLNLRSNRIGDAGASGLGSALAQCTNLSNLTLDLGGNQIGDAGASGLGSALAQCTNLSNLTLDLRIQIIKQFTFNIQLDIIKSPMIKNPKKIINYDENNRKTLKREFSEIQLGQRSFQQMQVVQKIVQNSLQNELKQDKENIQKFSKKTSLSPNQQESRNNTNRSKSPSYKLNSARISDENQRYQEPQKISTKRENLSGTRIQDNFLSSAKIASNSQNRYSDQFKKQKSNQYLQTNNFVQQDKQVLDELRNYCFRKKQ
ncbi:hypothetical protein ABPG72_020497 [Tetrahymena utriculariae]